MNEAAGSSGVMLGRAFLIAWQSSSPPRAWAAGSICFSFGQASQTHGGEDRRRLAHTPNSRHNGSPARGNSLRRALRPPISSSANRPSRLVPSCRRGRFTGEHKRNTASRPACISILTALHVSMRKRFEEKGKRRESATLVPTCRFPPIRRPLQTSARGGRRQREDQKSVPGMRLGLLT